MKFTVSPDTIFPEGADNNIPAQSHLEGMLLEFNFFHLQLNNYQVSNIDKRAAFICCCFVAELCKL